MYTYIFVFIYMCSCVCVWGGGCCNTTSELRVFPMRCSSYFYSSKVFDDVLKETFCPLQASLEYFGRDVSKKHQQRGSQDVAETSGRTFDQNKGSKSGTV